MENQKVQVKGGKYIGRKWFLRLAYKTIETEVDFVDAGVSMLQGSGFVSIKNKVRTNIRYQDITSVSTQRKYSLPNVILAIICALLTIILVQPAGIIPMLVVLFMGRTAQVKINNAGHEYIVPTEFMSEAQDLETKLNTAILQARS